jgi:hypothetical protein
LLLVSACPHQLAKVAEQAQQPDDTQQTQAKRQQHDRKVARCKVLGHVGFRIAASRAVHQDPGGKKQHAEGESANAGDGGGSRHIERQLYQYRVARGQVRGKWSSRIGPEQA